MCVLGSRLGNLSWNTLISLTTQNSDASWAHIVTPYSNWRLFGVSPITLGWPFVAHAASSVCFKNERDPRRIVAGTGSSIPDKIEQDQIPNWQPLDVKFGTFGEWQVIGRSKMSNFEGLIQMEPNYPENWGFGYDLKRLARKVFVIFSKHTGAV